MKVIRVFRNLQGGNLMRDTEQVEKDNVLYREYKPYKENKVKKIIEMGYFYNSDRKSIKKEFKTKNAMALSNGQYEKCLYTLKNGVLSIWRLNCNDKKAYSKKLNRKTEKSIKHYMKYNNRKWGVI